MTKIDNLVETQLKLIERVAEYEGSSLSKELDKLIGDQPLVTGVDFYKGFTIEQYACPRCGRAIGDETMMFSYCPGCGKRIVNDK